jgi:hypothetical protein
VGAVIPTVTRAGRSAATPFARMGRADRSGPSGRPAGLVATVRAALGVLLAAVTLAATLAACGSSGTAHHSSSEPPLGFRSLPTFLPTESTPVDRIVTATPSEPQLAVQGVGVQVVLPRGGTLATVTGPAVPPFVSPPPPAVTATFTVALARTAGAVPVRLADFTVTDQLGRTYHLTPTAGETLPASLPARGATFRLATVMPTGEGRLHWAPGGGAPVVSWDFIVEND